MNEDSARRLSGVPGPDAPPEEGLGELLHRVARGDERAFERVYDTMSAPVYGLIRRILRDPAQAEEVAQEVMVEIWRSASRYDDHRGSPQAWMMTLAHRRAVDRVRAEQAGSDREVRAAAAGGGTPYDEVEEEATSHLEGERVRRCLETLTELQRQSVRLAYYGGYTYREVAKLLSSPLGTVKTRMRDGLIRLRDCLGVEW
ncbi:sigma-70 family RNA polymerase sigma factor [Streptomonospora litoralis]|uniref:ECF RNA polymerase sigma factor SigK n=1 Tax=Streptomonospora litoralis TaxID=2498135 RepID=A0A4P6PZB2_9ACTN|nr:sigma-70 family RNA polymerase sigma factor [Streptomonospora litoralis]QBI53090.1 ECF RNA polymerase sigma factor SigK [Streptomonospora litoralis]